MSRPILQSCAVLACVVIAAGGAMAQAPPVPGNCNATLVCQYPAVSVFNVPNGSGRPLANCYAFPGIPTSATIMVTLRGAANLPVPGEPNRNIRINQFQPPLVWCPDSFYPPPIHAPNCADFMTNAAGQTQFTRAYHGGGWFFGGSGIWVIDATGAWAQIPTIVAVHMNSADINGDLVVNLTDIAIFAGDFFSATAPYRSDFNWDGAINLTDVAMFAMANGSTCP